MKTIIALLILFSIGSRLLAQPAPLPSDIIVEKTQTTTQDEEKLRFIKKNSKIDNPLGLRDPFKRILRSTQKESSMDGRFAAFAKEGSYSNIPSIDGTPLSQIKIVGVLLGPDRRAIAKKMDGEKLGNESFILKEGMTLGQEQAEIKAILPGGIVLVEKIKNVYDQDEYLETVVPIYNE